MGARRAKRGRPSPCLFGSTPFITSFGARRRRLSSKMRACEGPPRQGHCHSLPIPFSVERRNNHVTIATCHRANRFCPQLPRRVARRDADMEQSRAALPVTVTAPDMHGAKGVRTRVRPADATLRGLEPSQPGHRADADSRGIVSESLSNPCRARRFPHGVDRLA